MKEIGMLFSQPMVKAIGDNRKTQTRRIIKPQPDHCHRDIICKESPYNTADWSRLLPQIGDKDIKPPCQPGDCIYVKEKWGSYAYDDPESNALYFLYRADYPDDAKGYWYEPEQTNWCDFPKWRSPMFMPKEAARYKLNVLGVHPERLQEITEEDAIKEGTPYELCSGWHPTFNDPDSGGHEPDFVKGYSVLWDFLNAVPKPVRRKGIITHYESYPWDDIHEVREYRGKPWVTCGNPYIWRIAFERKVSE